MMNNGSCGNEIPTVSYTNRKILCTNQLIPTHPIDKMKIFNLKIINIGFRSEAYDQPISSNIFTHYVKRRNRLSLFRISCFEFRVYPETMPLADGVEPDTFMFADHIPIGINHDTFFFFD